jgi:hypothetical protein
VRVDLGALGFGEGGHLLVKRALRSGSAGEEIEVTGSAPELESHLRAWRRAAGHSLPGRTEGYAALDGALRRFGTLDEFVQATVAQCG